MKKVYSTREDYLPGYPIKDGGGWTTSSRPILSRARSSRRTDCTTAMSSS